MKPALFGLFVIMILATACKKETAAAPTAIPIQKHVEYHIFAAKDYSAPVYQNINTELRLQVRLINYKNGEIKLVWDSTFSTRKLTDFPSYDNRIIIKKTVPVMDSHEKLNGSYSVRYDDEGRIKQEGYSDEAVPGETSVLLEADM